MVNIDKSRCIPLSRARFDTTLLASLQNLYGDDFITNNFTASGVCNSIQERWLTYGYSRQ